MAYDTRNGGNAPTPPFGGSNRQPGNPACGPVTVSPTAPPTPQPVAPLKPASRINDFMFPASVPSGSPSRGIKPL